MHFSNKFNAQRGAKRAGVDPTTVEFFKAPDGWTWREPERIDAATIRTLTAKPDALTTLRQLVERDAGATIVEIAAATGLDKTAAHAKITAELKKRLGLKIASDTKDKARGGRIYRAVGDVMRPELPFFTMGAAHEAHA